MKNENEKKGLFDHLAGKKKTKKSSCCGSFEIEEIPDENIDDKNEKTPKQDKSNSCCK